MLASSAIDRFENLLPHLLVSIFAAIAIYGISVVAVDVKSIGALMGSLGFVGWGVVLGLSLVNYGLRFLRWRIYLDRLGVQIAVLRNLTYYLSAFAFSTTPGKAGEAIRSLYLKRHDVAYVDSLAAFFAERFIDLVAMVILSLIAAFSFPQYRVPVYLIAAIIIAMLPLIHAAWFQDLLARGVNALSSTRLRGIGSRVIDLMKSAATLLRSGPLYAGLVLAIVAWGAEGLAFYLILDALEVDAGIWISIGIYSISVLIGALSFIPGGLGTTEAVMVVLLKLLGADTPTAIAATLICRLATLWFAVVLGGLCFLSLQLRSKSLSVEPRRAEGESR